MRACGYVSSPLAAFAGLVSSRGFHVLRVHQGPRIQGPVSLLGRVPKKVDRGLHLGPKIEHMARILSGYLMFDQAEQGCPKEAVWGIPTGRAPQA